MQEHGTALASVSEGIDTSSATGVLVASIVGAVPQLERRNIAERMQSGLPARVRAGGWCGGDKSPNG